MHPHHDSMMNPGSSSSASTHYDYPTYYNSKYPYYSQQYSYTAGTGDHLNLNVNLNVNLLPNQHQINSTSATASVPPPPPIPPSAAAASVASAASSATVTGHQYYHYQNQCHQPQAAAATGSYPHHQNGVNYTPPHSPESIAGEKNYILISTYTQFKNIKLKFCRQEFLQLFLAENLITIYSSHYYFCNNTYNILFFQHIITNKDTITNNKCFITNHITTNIHSTTKPLIKDLQDKRYLHLLLLHLFLCILMLIILSITRCHQRLQL